MKPILVLYATREGQTQRIAEHVAATLRARGLPADVINAAALPSGFDLGAYAAAILAASVHDRRHEPEMVAFVRERLSVLERLPTAFLSVSMAEIGAEDEANSPERRALAAKGVQKLMDAFLQETGWHPRHLHPVAGAVVFSKYGLLMRVMMHFAIKTIAKRDDADTWKDHEYTDWAALDRFVDGLVEEMKAAGQPEGAPAPDVAR